MEEMSLGQGDEIEDGHPTAPPGRDRLTGTQVVAPTSHGSQQARIYYFLLP